MRTSEDVKTIQAMQAFGGSFIRALGQTAALADDVNLSKLKAAFPEYWSNFSEIAKERLKEGM